MARDLSVCRLPLAIMPIALNADPYTLLWCCTAWLQELYANIIAGKATGRSFAFNDDGYKNMEVADEWRGFAVRTCCACGAFGC